MEKKKERAAACQAGHYRVLQQGGTGKQIAVAEETEDKYSITVMASPNMTYRDRPYQGRDGISL